MLYSPRRARQFLHPLKRCHRSTISSTTSSIAGGTRHRSYRRVSTGISLHYQRPVLSMILTNKVRDLSGSGSKINAGILCVPCKARTSTLPFQTRRKEENGRAKHPRETVQVTTRMIIIILSDHQPVRATLPRKLTAIR